MPVWVGMGVSGLLWVGREGRKRRQGRIAWGGMGMGWVAVDGREDRDPIREDAGGTKKEK